jgi:hypothetical protein
MTSTPTPDQAPLIQAAGNSISPEVARRWNWGACFLYTLWPFFHGLPLYGIAGWALVFLSLVPKAGALFSLGGIALAIYLGVKGGELAVAKRVYGADANYIAVERAWAIGALWTYIISFVLGIVVAIIFFVALMATFHKQ